MIKYAQFLNKVAKGKEGIVRVVYYDRPQYIGTFVHAESTGKDSVRVHFTKNSVAFHFEPESIQPLYQKNIMLVTKNGHVTRKRAGCEDLWIGKMSWLTISDRLSKGSKLQ